MLDDGESGESSVGVDGGFLRTVGVSHCVLPIRIDISHGGCNYAAAQWDKLVRLP